jgi:hypothetical protein
LQTKKQVFLMIMDYYRELLKQYSKFLGPISHLESYLCYYAK